MVVRCSWQQAIYRAKHRTSYFMPASDQRTGLYVRCCNAFVIAATLLSLHSLIGYKELSCSNICTCTGDNTCSLPHATLFCCSLWHALLQDVSYEPERQVWSINDDALQPFVLS